MTAQTPAKIVDAAEMLLARDGWANVSVRAVAAQAGVNLSAISYHFGSFKSLRTEVLARRLVPLNEERRQNLVELQKLQNSGRQNRRWKRYFRPISIHC